MLGRKCRAAIYLTLGRCRLVPPSLSAYRHAAKGFISCIACAVWRLGEEGMMIEMMMMLAFFFLLAHSLLKPATTPHTHPHKTGPRHHVGRERRGPCCASPAAVQVHFEVRFFGEGSECSMRVPSGLRGLREGMQSGRGRRVCTCQGRQSPSLNCAGPGGGGRGGIFCRECLELGEGGGGGGGVGEGGGGL